MRKFIIAVAVVILAAFAVPAFAATNPFMDVPASHWAYDAVAQLAARGVISGYPDGSYKGAQPATRYEMASVVARAMAKIDMEKASKQDVEMLKKLIVEFKDELDALGVKVDKIDSRLAVLERDLGGWSISGQFRFDANFGSGDGNNWYGDDMTQVGRNDFDLNRYRMFFRKRINETTSFTARLGRDGGPSGPGHTNDGRSGVRWERYFITTQLGWGITMTAGLNYLEWETDLGFVGDNDPLVGVHTAKMFWFKKDWGMANLQLVIGRQNDAMDVPDNWGGGTGLSITDAAQLERFFIAGLANFDFNEKFRAGLMAYYHFADDEVNYGPGIAETDSDVFTLGVYAGFRFVPEVELKGIYYYQSLGDTFAGRVDGNTWLFNDDSANAWRIILDVDQDLLKFTDAWIEYGQMDNHFQRINGAVAYSGLGTDLLWNQPWNTNTTKVFGIKLQQKWNDKWRTYARYYQADYDTNGLDDAKNWTVGVGYRLNPAVEFELAYDNIDYGDNNPAGFRNDDDHLIRLRTFVTF